MISKNLNINRMKHIVLTFFFSLTFILTYAQVCFTYDDAGNRIKRQACFVAITNQDERELAQVSGLSTQNINDIPALMNAGERIAIGLNTGGSVGHSVVLDNVVSKTFQKVNGKVFTKLFYNAMNPSTGAIQRYSELTIRNAFGIVRIFP